MADYIREVVQAPEPCCTDDERDAFRRGGETVSHCDRIRIVDGIVVQWDGEATPISSIGSANFTLDAYALDLGDVNVQLIGQAGATDQVGGIAVDRGLVTRMDRWVAGVYFLPETGLQSTETVSGDGCVTASVSLLPDGPGTSVDIVERRTLSSYCYGPGPEVNIVVGIRRGTSGGFVVYTIELVGREDNAPVSVGDIGFVPDVLGIEYRTQAAASEVLATLTAYGCLT